MAFLQGFPRMELPEWACYAYHVVTCEKPACSRRIQIDVRHL